MRALVTFEVGRLRARLDNILDGRGWRERVEATRLGLGVALPLLLVAAWLFFHVTARPRPGAAEAAPQLLAQSAALTALVLVDAYRRAAQRDAFGTRYHRWLLALGIAPALVAGRALLGALAASAPFLWVPLVPLLPLRGSLRLGPELLALPAAAALLGVALGELDGSVSRGRWLRLVPAGLWAVPACAAVLPERHADLWRAAPLLGLWSAAVQPGGVIVVWAVLLLTAGLALALCTRALARHGWNGGAPANDEARQAQFRDALTRAAHVVDVPRTGTPALVHELLKRDLRKLRQWAFAEPLAPFVLVALVCLPYAARLPRSQDGLVWALLWSVSLAALALGEILWAGESAAWWGLLRATGRLQPAVLLRAAVLGVPLMAVHVLAGVLLPAAWRVTWLTLVLAMSLAAAAAVTAAATAALYAQLGGLLGRLARSALAAAALLATFALAVRQAPLVALLAAVLVAVPLLWLAPKAVAWSGAHPSTR